jgi:hypothetical protein
MLCVKKKACRGQALQIQAEHPRLRQTQVEDAGTKHVFHYEGQPAEPRKKTQTPNTSCIHKEGLPTEGFTNTSRAPGDTPDPDRGGLYWKEGLPKAGFANTSPDPNDFDSNEGLVGDSQTAQFEIQWDSKRYPLQNKRKAVEIQWHPKRDPM